MGPMFKFKDTFEQLISDSSGACVGTYCFERDKYVISYQLSRGLGWDVFGRLLNDLILPFKSKTSVYFYLFFDLILFFRNSALF